MVKTVVSSVVFSLALAASALAHGSTNVSIDSGRQVESCGDVRITFDFREAERAEDSFTLPGGAGPFRVDLPANSAIRVSGWDRNEFAVTACKAARDARSLAAIRISQEGSGLGVVGPRGEDWLVFLIVKAPRKAALDLAAKNGSIGVEETSGPVAARTVNGPIEISTSSGEIHASATNGPVSIDDCTGSGDARAVNGPISISGSSGAFRLNTENGPISVELRGDRWRDGSLEARAVNGPLNLRLPETYRSGVVVESLGHGPVSCPSSCRAARRTFDDDGRRIEFGDLEPVVRLSTRNGPVSIETN
ncbi:MAG TPA: hypothetical protein VFW15_16600 [Thermoanaerobaculia bacterium]|nr:hypothetical protein [Thermoanaerobaculia bacterium]